MAIGYNQSEKSVLLKVELDVKQAKINSEQAIADIKRIKEEQEKLKATTGTNTIEYAKLAAELRTAQKSLRENANALAINEKISKQATGSVNELKLAQAALTTQYNALSKEERENSKEGIALTKTLLEVSEALKDAGSAVGDNRRRVGEYETAIRKVVGELGILKKEQDQVRTAIGFNTQKLNDSTKALKTLEAKGLSPVDEEYKAVAKDVQFYTKALQTNEKTLDSVTKEIQQQENQLRETAREAQQIGYVYNETGEAANELGNDTADLSARFDEVYGDIQPLTGRIGELEDRLYELALAGKLDTEQFREIQAEVVKMKIAVIETDKAVDALVEESGVTGLKDQFIGLGDSILNLDFNTANRQLTALSGSTKNLNFDNLVKGLSQFGKGLAALGKALITNPLFLLAAAGATLIVFFDDIQEALKETDVAQEALKETTEDYKKAAVEATVTINKVGASFELAKKGVIGKDEALRIYNDTLGKSLGTAKSLNEAEALYVAKKDAYVEATAARAVADALAQKAAQARVDGLTAGLEDQTSFMDKAFVAFKNQFGSTKDLVEDLQKVQNKNSEEFAKDKNKEAKILRDLALKEQERAETIENQAGIISETEQKLNEEREKKAEELRKKLKEIAEQRIADEKEAAKRIREAILEGDELLLEGKRKAADAEFRFREQLNEIYGKTELDRAEKSLQIERDRLESLNSILAEEAKARENEINQRAADEIAALKGSEAQKAELKKLIEEQSAEQIKQIRYENGNALIEQQNVIAAKEIEITKLKNAELVDSDSEKLIVLQANLQHELNLREKLLQDELKQLRENGASADKIAEVEANRRLEILESTKDKRIEIAKQENQIIQDDATKSDAERLAAAVALETKLTEIAGEGVQERKLLNEQLGDFVNNQLTQATIAAAQQLVSDLAEIQQQQIQEELERVSSAYEYQNEQNQKRLDLGLISQEKFNEEQKKLQDKQAAEEAKLKKEAWKKKKQADLIQATISTALAVVQALASTPPPVSYVLATISGALGAVSIAKIASQPEPAFAGGGIVPELKTLSGQRIGTGDGIPIRRANGDDLYASVKRGEVILNESHQQALGGPATFAAIGVPGFAAGGAVGSAIISNQISDVAGAQANQLVLADALQNLPAPVVLVQDIEGGLGTAQQVRVAGNVFDN